MKTSGKMISSELSSAALPIAAIITILASYAILLVKLKPSRETQFQPAPDKDGKTEKNLLISRVRMPERTTKQTDTKRNTIQAVQSKRIQEGSIEIDKTAVQVQKTEGETQKRNNKDKDLKKSFLLFGKNDFKSCAHEFGHLGSLSKNTPISEECFGCPQILECLVSKKQ